MVFYAIGEPEFKTSNWYKRIWNGLINEKRQKRFALTVVDTVAQIDPAGLTDQDAIFVIGTNSLWLEDTIGLCQNLFDNRIIVLANHENRFSNGKYSIVTADLSHSVQSLYRYLQAHGKSRIAMYGTNPRSASDAYRKHSFLLCGGKESDLFYNDFSLSQCYADFSAKADLYDGVICVNDYAAISLIRHLPDYCKLFIVSCGAGNALSQHFRPSITHAHIPFEDFAGSGLEIYKLLKAPNAHAINIYLASDFILGETTGYLPFSVEGIPASETIYAGEKQYYSDAEIDEMMKVETLLNACDEADLVLVQGVLQQKSYAALAEELYMSVNGIKYKLKSMYRLCGVNTRTEFTGLLNKYFSCDENGPSRL